MLTDYLTTKETKIDEFKKLLRLDDNLKWLTRIISPLDPGLLLTDLLIEKATIFSSKKCPVMLTWNTGARPIGAPISIVISADGSFMFGRLGIIS